MNQRVVAAAAALLLVAGVAGALVVRDDGDGDQHVATDATTSTTEEVTTTTTASTSTTTTTGAAAVATTAAPTTSTTKRPTTTTTARGTFTISPTSGPGYQRLDARGTGCRGTDATATVYSHAPSGKRVGGDGGMAEPDGTWSTPISVPPDEGPGRYKVVATCNIPAGGGFTYAAQYYTVTS
ncbi:MAG TPA: hypothetical protein VM938_13255 [Acidimicrobiales bacterium]|nr:hypothetical protein [Acidimicrobiales bacterium]